MPKKIQISVLGSEKELQLLLNKSTTDQVRGRLYHLLFEFTGKEINDFFLYMKKKTNA